MGSHHAIVVGSRRDAILGLLVTLVLAVAFTGFQVFEYIGANFILMMVFMVLLSSWLQGSMVSTFSLEHVSLLYV